MIDTIKNNVSIIDLVNHIGLNINKSDFIFSIYKEDKTPSLKLYPKTNSFFCYATNQGGDVLKFYCDYYKVDIKEAVKELAGIFGITKQNNSFATSSKVEPIQPEYILLESEKDFFQERINFYQFEKKLNRKEAEQFSFIDIQNNRREIQTKLFEALYSFSISKGIEQSIYSYLTGTKRGLTDQSIKKYKLFSIHSVKEIIEFLRDTFPRDHVKLSGLFSKKYFVFTKHRLIIPFIEQDQIRYLRGRYFFEGNSKPESFGKYIGLNNWSSTLSPKRFFNLDLLKNLVPYSDLVITEGEFDSIIANQYDLDSIGISGVSNFPVNQINLIKYFNIYLAFDSDSAGEKAIEKVSALFERPIKTIKLKVHKDLTELYTNEKSKFIK